jgi:hypothetical protein
MKKGKKKLKLKKTINEKNSDKQNDKLKIESKDSEVKLDKIDSFPSSSDDDSSNEIPRDSKVASNSEILSQKKINFRNSTLKRIQSIYLPRKSSKNCTLFADSKSRVSMIIDITDSRVINYFT